MKRFWIIAAMALVTSVVGVVGGVRPAMAASLGKSETSVFASGNGTTYGSSIAIAATVIDDSASCPPDCDTPTGFVDFYAVTGTTQIFLKSLELRPGTTAQCGASRCAETYDPDTGDTIGTYCCLDPGTYTIKGNYVNGNFDFSTDTAKPAGSSTPQEFTFTKADTSTSMTQSSTSTAYGQLVTFNIHVGGASDPNAIKPKGSVDVVEGSTGATTIYGTATLDGGDATVKTAQLAPGAHSLRAVYGGDSRYNASNSSDVSHTVSKGATTSSLTTSASNTTFGQAVTLTDTVTAVAPAPPPGTPTGTVSFDDLTVGGTAGTKSLSSGVAALTTSSLSAGPHSIRASYAGDASFAGSTSNTVSVTVARADSTTELSTSTPTSPTFGQTTKLDAFVTGPNGAPATGTVQFKDGANNLGAPVTLSDNRASFSTSALGVGTHTITVVYGGDGNLNGSSSRALTVIVSKANTTTAVTASPNPSRFGQAVTLKATVSGANGTVPTGSVQFKDGASNVGGPVSLVNGVASVSTSALAVGGHTISAVFSGDANHNGSTGTRSQTVNKADTTTGVTSSKNPAGFGDAVTFTATVKAVAPGSGTPGGAVQFRDNGVNLGGPRTLAGGVASFSTPSLGPGTHSITAIYSGSGSYNGSSSPALSQSVTCTNTVSGNAPGGTASSSGSTCYSGANVSGSLSVPPGVKVAFINSTVAGSFNSSGAGGVTICGSTIQGGLNISGASGFVLVGDAVENACAGNHISSTVALSGNGAGLNLGDNVIGGSVTVTNNVGPGPAPDHTSPEVEANNITGMLSCSGNNPVVTNDGRPNTAAGRSGECGAPGF